jgi:hypothetical protein
MPWVLICGQAFGPFQIIMVEDGAEKNGQQKLDFFLKVHLRMPKQVILFSTNIYPFRRDKVLTLRSSLR